MVVLYRDFPYSLYIILGAINGKDTKHFFGHSDQFFGFYTLININ